MNYYVVRNMVFSKGSIWAYLTEQDLRNNLDTILKINTINISNTDKVLDMGCGDGVMLKHLQDLYGADITGVDILKLNIKKCKKTIPNGTFYKTDLIEYVKNCESNSFNFIMSYGVITYFTDTEKKEIIYHSNRILKKGGSIWIGDMS
jgi:cyclopropane fatty-acyl-phospholipid synthase-like methyltransferase